MKTDYFSIIVKSCTLLMLFGPVTDVQSLDIRKYAYLLDDEMNIA